MYNIIYLLYDHTSVTIYVTAVYDCVLHYIVPHFIYLSGHLFLGPSGYMDKYFVQAMPSSPLVCLTLTDKILYELMKNFYKHKY